MSSPWKKLRQALYREGFARNVATLAGGTTLAQIITILASPILTRLYDPADIGRLGLYMSFIGFASAIGSLRYESAIASAKDSRDAAHLLILSILLVLPISLLSSAAFYLMLRLSLLGFGTLPHYSTLFVIPSLVCTVAFFALRFWFIRLEDYNSIARGSVFLYGTRAASQVGLGLFGLGWIGLLLGEILGRVFGFGRLARSAWRAVQTQVMPFQKVLFSRTLYTYRKFPIYSLPSTIVDSMALALPIPLITEYYGTESAGHFSLVQMVLSLPVALVGGSVADAFHGRIAVYAQKESRETLPFFLRTARMLLVIGVGPALVLMIMGPNLFGWVFGRTWTLAGQLAAVMAPWALAGLVVTPLSRVIFVYQRQEMKFVYDVLNLVGVVGLLTVGRTWEFNLAQAVGLLSFGMVLAYGVYFLLLLKVIRRSF